MSKIHCDFTALGESVRRQDHDRYAATMFAAPALRQDLWVLLAFNQELAQIRQQVREPMAGMIRLQWWRDVIEGCRADEAARHPVAGPLRQLINQYRLDPADFLRLLEARGQDLDRVAFPTQGDWLRYGEESSGILTRLAARVLTGADESAATAVGTAWALTGLLRSLPFHLAQGWLTLPVDVLARFDLEPEAVLAAKAEPSRLAAVVMALLPTVEALLRQARRDGAPRAALAAVLPAVMASAYVRRIACLNGNVFDSRAFRSRPMPLRLSWAALRGRF